MMTKEEKIIRNMKKRRRSLIIASIVLIMMMLAALAFVIHQDQKVTGLVNPERVRTMVTFEDPKTELPVLFCWFHTLAGYSAKLMFYGFFSSCFIGLFIGLLIIEVFDLSHRRLIVTMWEKIQQLEQQSKDHPKSDGQQEVRQVSSDGAP